MSATYRRIDVTDEGEEAEHHIMYGNWGYGSISLSLAEDICTFDNPDTCDNVCAALNWLLSTHGGGPPHKSFIVSENKR